MHHGTAAYTAFDAGNKCDRDMRARYTGVKGKHGGKPRNAHTQHERKPTSHAMHAAGAFNCNTNQFLMLVDLCGCLFSEEQHTECRT